MPRSWSDYLTGYRRQAMRLDILYFLHIPQQPIYTLFPYTTLFRSASAAQSSSAAGYQTSTSIALDFRSELVSVIAKREWPTLKPPDPSTTIASAELSETSSGVASASPHARASTHTAATRIR